MREKLWDGRVPLEVKLTILVTAAVLLVTLALVAFNAPIYSMTVQNVYDKEADKVLDRIQSRIDGECVENFWKATNSYEFKQNRRQALEKKDSRILSGWMRKQPSYLSDPGDEMGNGTSLYGDYVEMRSVLSYSKSLSSAESVFLQRVESGTTYILVYPDQSVTDINRILQESETFHRFRDNEALDGTIFRSEDTWYFMKSVQIYAPAEEGETIICTGNAIYDVSGIMRGRHQFILYSILFALGFMALVIFLTTTVMRHTVTTPLRELARAATAFGSGEKSLTKESVIDLDIRSDDEIGELYQEIRSMQTRIVDYTDNLAEVTRERARVSTELKTAANIQAAMLPDTFPAFPDRKDFDLYASMRPAKEVGGDFYDFFFIDDDHLAVLIADVSEKGIPAALLMMSTMILLRYRARSGGTPGEIVTAVNAEVAQNNRSKMFVTVWMGILDLKSGVMTCTNAGHLFPAIRNKTGAFTLFQDRHGLVVGGLKNTKYQDYELTLEPGDAVFVYTDGVTEAKDTAGTFYGSERMENALNRASKGTPEKIITAVRDDVDQFVGEAEQFDDMTMLCIEYKGPEKEKAEKPEADKPKEAEAHGGKEAEAKEPKKPKADKPETAEEPGKKPAKKTKTKTEKPEE